jgi:hypothetical protein
MKVKSAIIPKRQKVHYLFPLSPKKKRIKSGFIHQKRWLCTFDVNKLVLSTKIAGLRYKRKPGLQFFLQFFKIRKEIDFTTKGAKNQFYPQFVNTY